MNDTDLSSVTEPRDFSNERLVSLDASLRCGICKDLVQVPMFAPCSHSFCSMCIRESLLVNPTCPICRATVSDGQLKRNTMLSEIVEAYKLARDVMLQHERRQLTQFNSAVLGKRKRSDASLVSDDTPQDLRKNPATRSLGGTLRTNGHDDSETASKGQSMVSCPICEEIIDAEFINKHLDRDCDLRQHEIERSKRQTEESKPQAMAWAKLLGSNATKSNLKLKSTMEEIPSKRMSKTNYDVKSTRQMREMLAEVGLNDKGEPSQLRLRHERFVNLWNSEIDATKPRSRTALLRDMLEWEKARLRAKPIPKVDSPKNWLESNRSQFDQLVSKARPKPNDESNHTDSMEPNIIPISSSPPSSS